MRERSKPLQRYNSKIQQYYICLQPTYPAIHINENKLPERITALKEHGLKTRMATMRKP